MNRDALTRIAVFCGLVALAVTVRLISETPNFNAVTAATLFAGFFFRSRVTAICVPLAIMSISDVFLGGYARQMMVAVYASMLVPIAWRSVLQAKMSCVHVAAAAVSSSLAFYLLSNAAVWFAWYPGTWQGLLKCYAAALPFFANALAGDLLFAAGFFGAYVLATAVNETPVEQAVIGEAQA